MADTNQILRLAAIIREVDGTHSKGAAALAESILDHPDFRAALAKADGPAVPEGREPAAVAGQPSDEELADTYWTAWHEHFDRTNSVLHSVGLRAVLARWGNAAPLPPADGEVADVVRWLRSRAGIPASPDFPAVASYLTRAAELLQRQALVPVSVSERPWEREGWCDVEGRFWAEHISRSGVASWRCAAASDLGGWAVRCLPAHALPVPEVGE